MIKIDLELYDFTDENSESERFVEFLSFYNVGTVFMNSCVLRLRTSAMYLIAPATEISMDNCYIRIPRADQICKCHKLKLINTKLVLKQNIEQLFGNVTRAYIDNCMMRENLMLLFTNKLQQLVVKKSYSY